MPSISMSINRISSNTIYQHSGAYLRFYSSAAVGFHRKPSVANRLIDNVNPFLPFFPFCPFFFFSHVSYERNAYRNEDRQLSAYCPRLSGQRILITRASYLPKRRKHRYLDNENINATQGPGNTVSTNISAKALLHTRFNCQIASEQRIRFPYGTRVFMDRHLKRYSKGISKQTVRIVWTFGCPDDTIFHANFDHFQNAKSPEIARTHFTTVKTDFMVWVN